MSTSTITIIAPMTIADTIANAFITSTDNPTIYDAGVIVTAANVQCVYYSVEEKLLPDVRLRLSKRGRDKWVIKVRG